MVRYWLVALIVGAGLCTVLDHQHVVWGVLAYPHPDFWEQAWWVPLLFFTSTLAALWATEPLRRLVGGSPAAVSPALALGGGASFAGAHYPSGRGHPVPHLGSA